MENQKIKKVNVPYLIIYILAPIILIVLTTVLGAVLEGQAANVMLMLTVFLFLGSIFWWGWGWKILYNKGKKRMEKELDSSGFVRNHTFNGDGCTIVVDVVHGNIAVIFRMNPFETQRFPAKKIQKLWVDDGKSGAGFMTGSSRVSFMLMVDGIKIRVNTFISNQRWRMDSDHILTGISKADMMIEVIKEAMGKAQ